MKTLFNTSKFVMKASKIELSAEIVNSFQPLTIFAKYFIVEAFFISWGIAWGLRSIFKGSANWFKNPDQDSED